MSKPLLIFDFDGTIADTTQVLIAVGNEILAENKLDLIPESKFEQIRGMSIKEGLRFFDIPLRKLPKLIAGTKKRLHESIDSLEPITGMVELINTLHESDKYSMIVLTSNSESNVRFFLDKYSIEHCFSEVQADVGLFSKAKRMSRVIKAHRGSYSSVVAIGDEVRDIEAAHKSGLPCIAVSWGFNSSSKLLASNPTTVVDEPNKLIQEIEKLTK